MGGTGHESEVKRAERRSVWGSVGALNSHSRLCLQILFMAFKKSGACGCVFLIMTEPEKIHLCIGGHRGQTCGCQSPERGYGAAAVTAAICVNVSYTFFQLLKLYKINMKYVR